MAFVRMFWLPLALMTVDAVASIDCASAADEAERISALRDSDPAQGWTQGLQAIERLQVDDATCRDGLGRLLAAVGSNLHVLGRNQEALQKYLEALELVDDVVDPALHAVLHRGAGVALTDLEDLDEALRHYLQALAISDQAGDRLEFAKTAGNIGNLHNTLNDGATAADFHQRALQAFREVDWKPGIAGSLINLGAAASKLAYEASERGDEDAARFHNQELLRNNQQALELFSELGNPRGIAYAASNIGLAHHRLGDPERALRYHERSLTLREEIGDVYGMVNSLHYMVQAELSLGRIDAARAHLDRAEQTLPEDGNQGLKLELVGYRVQLAEAEGQLDEALVWQRDYLERYRQMMEHSRRSQVLELRERFAAEEQTRQIERLSHQEEINRLRLQRQQLLIRGAFLFAVLGLIVLIVLASRMQLVRRRARELDQAARTDPLTGLPNRRDIVARIDRTIERAEQDGRQFCLVMADIDNFKQINDRHGHDVGDAVLVEVARRIGSAIRAGDRVARWGGEEFLLLLPDTGLDGACRVAEAVQGAVANGRIAADTQPFELSLSIGIARYRPGMGRDACLKAADGAMFQGKRDGRNCIRIAPDADGDPNSDVVPA